MIRWHSKTFLWKVAIFCKTKQYEESDIILNFANLFNVWPHRRQLDCPTCLRSVVTFYVMSSLENPIAHWGEDGGKKGKNVLVSV